MAYVVGIDIGGAFTDAFATDESGLVLSAKTPSTPLLTRPAVWREGLRSEAGPQIRGKPELYIDEKIVFRQ